MDGALYSGSDIENVCHGSICKKCFLEGPKLKKKYTFHEQLHVVISQVNIHLEFSLFCS
jgi:hypothetical protein